MLKVSIYIPCNGHRKAVRGSVERFSVFCTTADKTDSKTIFIVKHLNVKKNPRNYFGDSHFNHGALAWVSLGTQLWGRIWTENANSNVGVCLLQSKPSSVPKVHEAHCQRGWKKEGNGSKERGDRTKREGKQLREKRKDYWGWKNQKVKTRFSPTFLSERWQPLSWRERIQHQRHY